MANPSVHSLDALEPQPGIERLIIHGCGLQSLESSLNLPNLRHLNVSSNQLFELDLSDLFRYPLLSYIDAAANSISRIVGVSDAPQGVSTIVLAFNAINSLSFLASDALPSLARLDVRDNRVSSLVELAPLRHAPSLRELRLQNATITGSGLSMELKSRCSNPVCDLPGYAAFVLATCPSLQVLDEVPVDRWREYLAVLGTREAAVSDCAQPRSDASTFEAMPGLGRPEEMGAHPTGGPITTLDSETRSFFERQGYVVLHKSQVPALSGLDSHSVAQRAQQPSLLPQRVQGLSAQPQEIEAGPSPARSGTGGAPDAATGGTGESLRLTHSAMPSAVATAPSAGVFRSGFRAESASSPATSPESASTHGSPAPAGRIARGTQHQQLVSALKADNAAMKRQVLDITAARDAARGEAKRLRALLESSRSDAEALRAGTEERVRAFTAQCEALQAQLLELSADVSSRPAAGSLEMLRTRLEEREMQLADSVPATVLAQLRERLANAEREAAEARDKDRAASSSAASAAAARDKALVAEALARSELTDVQERLSSALQQLGRAKRDASSESERISQLEEEVRKVQYHADAASAAEETARILSSRLESAQGEIRYWRARHDEAVDSTAREVAAERARGAAAVADSEARLHALRVSAEDDIRRLSSDVSAQLSTARAALASHSAQASASAAGIADALADNHQLRAALDAALAESTAKDGRIAALQADLAVFHCSIELVKAEVAAPLEASVRDLEQRLHEALDTSPMAGLQASQAAAQKELASKTSLLQEQSEAIASLHSKLTKAREDAATVDVAHRGSISDLRAQCERLTSERDASREDASRARASAAGARKLAEQVDAALGKTQALLAGKQQALERTEGELQRVRSSYESRLASLAEHREADAQRVAQLSAKVDGLFESLAAAQSRAAASAADIARLETSLAAKEAQLASETARAQGLAADLVGLRSRSRDTLRRIAEAVLSSQQDDVDILHAMHGNAGGCGPGAVLTASLAS